MSVSLELLGWLIFPSLGQKGRVLEDRVRHKQKPAGESPANWLTFPSFKHWMLDVF